VQMTAGANSDSRIAAWFCAVPLTFLQEVSQGSTLRVRGGGEDNADRTDLAPGLEIAKRIVGNVREDGRRLNESARCEYHRMPVRRGLHDFFGPDNATGARAVLHNDRLLPLGLKTGGDKARDAIGCTARRGRNNNSRFLLREFLRRR